MGELELILLNYYRKRNNEGTDLLTFQEAQEWLWLVTKMSFECQQDLNEIERIVDEIHR